MIQTSYIEVMVVQQYSVDDTVNTVYQILVIFIGVLSSSVQKEGKNKIVWHHVP